MKSRIELEPGTDYKALMAEYGIPKTTAYNAVKRGYYLPKDKTKEPHGDSETFQKFFDIIRLDYINAYGFTDIDSIRLQNILAHRTFYLTVSETQAFREQLQDLIHKLNALINSNDENFITNFKAICTCRFIHKRVLFGYKYSYQIKNKRKILFIVSQREEVKEIAGRVVKELE